MGQHFLVDRGVLMSIVTAANLLPGTLVLEVGGGFGVLTLELLRAGARVTVVELDRKLADALRKLAQAGGNLTVVEGDVIRVPDDVLSNALGLTGEQGFSVVANLPYEISGAFLRRFLGGQLRPHTMVLLLQREVAARLQAPAGETSLLSLSAQLACTKVETVRGVSPRSFFPAPRVESAVVRFTLRSAAEREALLQGVPEPELWRVAHIGFAARRKLLSNNLASAFALERPGLEACLAKATLSPLVRAQELELSQWISLAQALHNAPLKASAATPAGEDF
jgi:16S rRNA (adenine1518-N6/adenine1519-N6)-dimethyltransferase